MRKNNVQTLIHFFNISSFVFQKKSCINGLIMCQRKRIQRQKASQNIEYLFFNIILQYTNSGSLCSLARKGIHRTGKKQNWNPVADLTWARGCAVPAGVASSNFHRRQYSPEGCARRQMDHKQPTTGRTRQDSTGLDKNSPRQKHRALAEDQKRVGRMAAKHNNLTK